MSVRNQFYKPDEKEGKSTGKDTKVQQQFADQADITKIVKRFQKTGALTSMATQSGLQRQPSFGEYPHQDFVEMYNHVQKVKEDFQKLPARIRARFDNNPHNVIRFVSDKANLKESVKLGLLVLPEGYELTKQGEIVEQIDLTKQGQKADDEANPHMGAKGGGT